MTALLQPSPVSIEGYLAGEEHSEVKHEYLSIPSLKVLLLAESDRPYVLVCRRQPEGGFAAEAHSGLAAVIDLPEIGAALPLADLYEGICFPAPRGDS